MTRATVTSSDTGRIAEIVLHPSGDGPSPEVMAYERDTALRDLTKGCRFQPLNDVNGPYYVDLSVQENKLVFQIRNAAEKSLPVLILSLQPYRTLIRDYFLMIESYEQVRASGNRSKLEAIDMGRRGIHDEAAEMMIFRLKDKISMDHKTARRLFTLVCVLHIGQVRNGVQTYRF